MLRYSVRIQALLINCTEKQVVKNKNPRRFLSSIEMENYSSPRSYYGPSDSLSILKTTPRDRNYMHVSNSNARNNFKHSDENLPLYTENSVLKERSVSPRNTPRFSHTNREFIPVPGNPQG